MTRPALVTGRAEHCTLQLGLASPDFFYLGGVLRRMGSNGPQIDARIQATRIAYYLCGSVWNAGAPRNVVRSAFLAGVYNITLSGMEAYVLSQHEEHQLDVIIVKNFRVLLHDGRERSRMVCENVTI